MGLKRAPRYNKRGNFNKAISENYKRINKFDAQDLSNKKRGPKHTDFKKFKKNTF